MFGTNSAEGYTEIFKGIRIKTIVSGDKTLMTEFVMDKGADLSEHSHVHEQTGYLVKGRIRLHIEGASMELGPRGSWCVPSNVKHRAEILEDSIAIEVFSPHREEYEKFSRKDDQVG